MNWLRGRSSSRTGWSESASGIEIDEPCSAPWMVGGDGAQFFACNRMPDEDGIRDMQGVKNGDDIVSEPPWVITGLRRGGLTRPAPRDPNHVIMRASLGPKLSKT
jgi:hypothetical protein